MTSDALKRQASPRERIIAAARDLFYRQGIRAVGVEAVAEAAGTNKMTLYRHFPSKDELVAECLREFAKEADAKWTELERAHPEPRARLHAWLEGVAERERIAILLDLLGRKARVVLDADLVAAA